MIANIVSWLITIMTVGALGWSCGRRRAKPTRWYLFTALFVVALFGLALGENAILIGAADINLYFNRAIFIVCVGGILGLAVSNHRLRRGNDG